MEQILAMTTLGRMTATDLFAIGLGIALLAMGRRLYWLALGGVGFFAGLWLAGRFLHLPSSGLELGLGFLLFAGRSFVTDPARETRTLDVIAWALLLPALYSLWTAIGFAAEIAGGTMWNGIDEGIRAAETWHYGAPLWAATAGAIILSWFNARTRGIQASSNGTPVRTYSTAPVRAPICCGVGS